MTDTITDPDAPPVLTFTTTQTVRKRPTLQFDLDGRTVVATAPKAARWARMWAAGASGSTQMMCYEALRFVDVCLGDDVAKWIKAREDDPQDAFDIPDLLNLIRFLNTNFEPLLKDDFEAAGVPWQDEIATPAAAARNTTGKPRASATKSPAARRKK